MPQQITKIIYTAQVAQRVLAKLVESLFLRQQNNKHQ
jgi:predicted transcriptional regulator